MKQQELRPHCILLFLISQNGSSTIQLFDCFRKQYFVDDQTFLIRRFLSHYLMKATQKFKLRKGGTRRKNVYKISNLLAMRSFPSQDESSNEEMMAFEANLSFFSSTRGFFLLFRAAFVSPLLLRSLCDRILLRQKTKIMLLLVKK